jgi:hypothetical protein
VVLFPVHLILEAVTSPVKTNDPVTDWDPVKNWKLASNSAIVNADPFVCLYVNAMVYFIINIMKKLQCILIE